MTRKKRRAAAVALNKWRTMLFTCTAISIVVVALALIFFPDHIWVALVIVLAMGCWALSRIIR